MPEKQQKPIIAATMGDPAGIGPEILIGALNNEEIYSQCSPLVVGNSEILRKTMDFMRVDLEINEICNPYEGIYRPGTIDIISNTNLKISDIEIGKVQAKCGQAAYEYIVQAIELANSRKVDAIATTPINKESLRAAGVPYIDHTSIFEALTNSRDPLTMFQVRSLRIFFLTRHLSIKDAIGQITKERIYNYLIRCKNALNKLGVEKPTLAVAALNPHGGEGGLFGTEEVEEIIPGIEKAVKKGIDVHGPIPADSVFHQAQNGKYDAVLSLYHDQGHIAAKMLDFERTVSITNGLPFLRTSVDHGTAFDIAGKGIASSISMEECIKIAAKYAPNYISH